MLKFFAVLAGLAVLVVMVRSCNSESESIPADPISSSANLDLRVRAQAGVQVTVGSLSNQIKLVMAAGTQPAQRAALNAEIADLHAKVNTARAQMITLGDAPAAVEQWLVRIGWPEFQRLEAEYRKDDVR